MLLEELIEKLQMLQQLLAAQGPTAVHVLYERVPVTRVELRGGVDGNLEVVLKG